MSANQTATAPNPAMIAGRDWVTRQRNNENGRH